MFSYQGAACPARLGHDNVRDASQNCAWHSQATDFSAGGGSDLYKSFGNAEYKIASISFKLNRCPKVHPRMRKAIFSYPLLQRSLSLPTATFKKNQPDLPALIDDLDLAIMAGILALHNRRFDVAESVSLTEEKLSGLPLPSYAVRSVPPGASSSLPSCVAPRTLLLGVAVTTQTVVLLLHGGL